MPTLADARKQLARYWRHPDFRWSQRRVVLAALRGRDCLAVLPTGGGKSICFQVPGLLLPGTTLVVSPLISLMQDQVAVLVRHGIAAAYLSSTQKPAERAAVREALLAGRLKLLYAAPERLGQFATTRWRPPLLAVDEAHCISEWGHEFRPQYRAIGRWRAALGRPPTVAVTGTATPATREDIRRVLGLRRPVIVATPADRPNLRFAARAFQDDRARVVTAARLARATPGTVIVYLPTRDRTDGVAGAFRRWGIAAAPYHAGLPAGARRALLTRFAGGRLRAMIATSAFGLGIDKPDVRLVLHLGVPPRPEAYWQEAGRAGRDGAPAACLMLWTPGDLLLARRMAGAGPAATAGLATMRRYVRTRGCRRALLLAFLGDPPPPCGGCDRCGTRVLPPRAARP